MQRKFLILLFFSALIVSACIKEPQNPYPKEPQIYYKGLSNNNVNFFDTGYACIIHLSFNDGDGDLGRSASDSDTVVTLMDYRSDTLFRTFTYPFPYIDQDVRKYSWIYGGFDISLLAAYFTPRTDAAHSYIDPVTHQNVGRDTLYFKVFITDEAGNNSDTVQTEPIYMHN